MNKITVRDFWQAIGLDFSSWVRNHRFNDYLLHENMQLAYVLFFQNMPTIVIR